MSDASSPPLRFSSTTLAAIGLIVGLGVQTAGIVWWGAHIDQRMTQVEAKVSAGADTAALLARLDERTNGLVITVNRIDAHQTAQDDVRLNNRK